MNKRGPEDGRPTTGLRIKQEEGAIRYELVVILAAPWHRCVVKIICYENGNICCATVPKFPATG